MLELTGSDSLAHRDAAADRRKPTDGGATTAAPKPAQKETRSNPHALGPAPIRQEWILEGLPQARSKVLASSNDKTTFTVMWDCTAGRFNWFYDVDETICLVEGAISLRDATGALFSLAAGDSFFFPAGSQFEWTVPLYVRKVAVIHVPLSRKLRIAQGIYRLLTRPFKRQTAATAGWGETKA